MSADHAELVAEKLGTAEEPESAYSATQGVASGAPKRPPTSGSFTPERARAAALKSAEARRAKKVKSLDQADGSAGRTNAAPRDVAPSGNAAIDVGELVLDELGRDPERLRGYLARFIDAGKDIPAGLLRAADLAARRTDLVEASIPRSVARIRAMSVDERIALLGALEARGVRMPELDEA